MKTDHVEAYNVRAAKREKEFRAKHLKSAAATLLVTAALLICIIAGGVRKNAAFVYAALKSDMLYIISYIAPKTDGEYDELEEDMNKLFALGLSFCLPDDITSVSGAKLMLVFEKVREAERLIELLEKNGARGVILFDNDTEPSCAKTVFEYEKKGIVCPASGIEQVESPIALIKNIASSKLDFLNKYNRKCRVFIHTCGSILCKERLDAEEYKVFGDNIVIFFGNGANDLSAMKNKSVFTRILKLPEWSIETYFNSIVGNDQS